MGKLLCPAAFQQAETVVDRSGRLAVDLIVNRRRRSVERTSPSTPQSREGIRLRVFAELVHSDRPQDPPAHRDPLPILPSPCR